MACFGAVQARAELGVLSAARTLLTTSTTNAIRAVIPGNRRMSVVGRPKEAILHYCVAVFKLYIVVVGGAGAAACARVPRRRAPPPPPRAAAGGRPRCAPAPVYFFKVVESRVYFLK